MNEARSILGATAQLRAAGMPFVVATVVSVRGSSYRRPGARLIATAERRVAGSVSGGCLEKDLVRTSWWRTRNGAVVIRYDGADTESPQAALGCGGEVDVLLERANDGCAHDPMTLVEHAMGSERVSALATVYRSTSPRVPVGTRWCMSGGELVSSEEDLGAERDRIASACEHTMASRRVSALVHESADGGSFEALVEPLVPPPHVFVFGTGLDAVPVVESALRLGWNATVWEPSAHVETRARFGAMGATIAAGSIDAVRERLDACDQALAIVMGHDVRTDGSALGMLLASQVRYIGVLGPRHRTSTLASEAELRDPRVHAPVGLDLGAETPEEIAVSITAEMLATLRQTTGERLRTRPTIHHDTP